MLNTSKEELLVLPKEHITPEQAGKIRELMQSMMDRPRDYRMPWLLIAGPLGAGKSALIHEFKNTHGKPYTGVSGTYHEPTLLINAPSLQLESNFYVDLLSTASPQPWIIGASILTLRAAAVAKAKELNTRLLIIDDTENILESTPHEQIIFMNAVKHFSNATKASVVFAGSEDTTKLLLLHEQFASRCDVALVGAKQ